MGKNFGSSGLQYLRLINYSEYLGGWTLARTLNPNGGGHGDTENVW